MHRSCRLTSPLDFQKVREQGKVYRNSRLVALIRPNGLAFSRFGFVTGRRLGKAVMRNRVRRLMRETARHLSGGVAGGHDIVLIATRQAVGASYNQISESMRRVLWLAGLLGGQV